MIKIILFILNLFELDVPKPFRIIINFTLRFEQRGPVRLYIWKMH